MKRPTQQRISVDLKPDVAQFVAAIPSATTMVERQLAIHWAGSLWDGKGDVFENGTLLGGVTRALAVGMLSNVGCEDESRLHTYDWFSTRVDDVPPMMELMDDLIGLRRVTPTTYARAVDEGTLLPIFEELHRGFNYSPLVVPHVGYLPGHPGDESPYGEPTFSVADRDRDFTLLFIDGCKSWYGTKFWAMEIADRVPAGATLMLQDFGQHTCFWLPMLLGLLREHFSLLGWADHTYVFRVLSPLTATEIDDVFPDEPTGVTRELYDEVFDHLIAHAEFRDDVFAKCSLSCQRAAAYAYLGLEDEAVVLLDALRTRTEFLPFRQYLLAARRSPTYTPEGPIRLPEAVTP